MSNKTTKENFDKDFTQKEVEELCKKYNIKIKDFDNFMFGQIMSMNDKGETVYYGCDVKRFFTGIGEWD